jgi:hypothetical protein
MTPYHPAALDPAERLLKFINLGQRLSFPNRHMIWVNGDYFRYRFFHFMTLSFSVCPVPASRPPAVNVRDITAPDFMIFRPEKFAPRAI